MFRCAFPLKFKLQRRRYPYDPYEPNKIHSISELTTTSKPENLKTSRSAFPLKFKLQRRRYPYDPYEPNKIHSISELTTTSKPQNLKTSKLPYPFASRSFSLSRSFFCRVSRLSYTFLPLARAMVSLHFPLSLM